MPNSTAQDERRALAERLEFGLRANCTHYALRIEECELVVAALRAEPAREAEAMEELADKLAEIAEYDLREYARDSLVGVHPDQKKLRRWANLMDEAAAAIRALPAQGGEDG